ncbi:hypothetical protein HOP50_19g83340 [Chloropicon primus]|uniref:Uncharacterized protein n=1 Tax=Chloropicon primus TaxID=1764295 RepID=A0A5B8N139_9CHLO|nr:hypothetical protein A3770_19p83100 [Chloropicon primus]UPR04987.1 hypothetical protein HOP50_19g83340 [Chloropicon primus]|mmetsp:Transcript_1337/g.3841  ORF Transcript_1337/g.3841 Transcript_1337/m.3841 type:complete len:433 (-) Transcript_1337:178-1476(-)|eukprot:QDZ25792.1 hypothetical protein A3770_19p83100 [Chloropicon primus]
MSAKVGLPGARGVAVGGGHWVRSRSSGDRLRGASLARECLAVGGRRVQGCGRGKSFLCIGSRNVHLVWSGAFNGAQSLRGGEVEDENERYDRLAEVFANREEAAWERLMAQSRRWDGMREGFFRRLRERGEEEEGELLGRLEEANERYARKKEIFDKLTEASDFDLEGLVALYGERLDQEFFDFCRDVILSYKSEKDEQERLANSMSAVITLREAQVDLEDDAEALQKASEQLGKILESASLEEAEKQIDGLLETGGMDPALMMMMAKAWAGAKESSMMKEEAKDVMFHLYNKARDGLTEQQPTEFKILKFVVSQPTARERRDALEAAFTPGLNYESGDTEYLSTTPEKLLKTVDTVLSTYELQRMKYNLNPMAPAQALKTREGELTGSEVFVGMQQEAQRLPGSNVIEDLREIKVMIMRDFMTGQSDILIP